MIFSKWYSMQSMCRCVSCLPTISAFCARQQHSFIIHLCAAHRNLLGDKHCNFDWFLMILNVCVDLWFFCCLLSILLRPLCPSQFDLPTVEIYWWAPKAFATIIYYSSQWRNEQTKTKNHKKRTPNQFNTIFRAFLSRNCLICVDEFHFSASHNKSFMNKVTCDDGQNSTKTQMNHYWIIRRKRIGREEEWN